MHCRSLTRVKALPACVKQAGNYACLMGGLLMAGPLLGGAGTSDTDDWRLVETTSAGQIFHREVEGSSIPWIMIVTTFDAPPERVHAVVLDYDHFAEFIPHVFRSRVVAQEGNAQWVYHHLQFPGPVADRVYLIRSTDSEGRAGHSDYRVEWLLDERAFPGIDRAAGIQPDAFSGFWELRAAGNPNSTEGRYAVYSEPGGFIPGWLVTRMTDRYVQQVVEAVRKRLGAGE